MRRYTHIDEKKNHSGYTLVELSVTMAVAGMIVLASIAGAMSLIDKQKINEISAQNADAIIRINSAYFQLPSYSSLSLRQAVSFGAFNQFTINQSGTDNVTVTHSFGGAVDVGPLNGSAPMAWGLYLNAIPAKICADLVFQSSTMSDALVLFPGGMHNLTDWKSNLSLNTAEPAIMISGGLSSGGAALIVKNLTTDISPALLSTACGFADTNFGLLLLKSKLR